MKKRGGGFMVNRRCRLPRRRSLWARVTTAIVAAEGEDGRVVLGVQEGTGGEEVRAGMREGARQVWDPIGNNSRWGTMEEEEQG